MTKAIVNSLAMAIAMEWGELDGQTVSIDLHTALDFAKDWVEQNADLFAPVVVDYGRPVSIPQSNRDIEAQRTLLEAMRPEPQVADVADDENIGLQTWQVRKGNDEVAPKFIQRVVGPDGLTDIQRRGLTSGVGLCKNCQQPNNDHLKGCIRDPQSGFSPTDRAVTTAVTKDRLPPRA